MMVRIYALSRRKHWQSPPGLYKKRDLEVEQMVQANIFKHGRGRVAKNPVDCFQRNKFTPCILLTSRVSRSYDLHKSESLPPARDTIHPNQLKHIFN
jgi:hypothetical protein